MTAPPVVALDDTLVLGAPIVDPPPVQPPAPPPPAPPRPPRWQRPPALPLSPGRQTLSQVVRLLALVFVAAVGYVAVVSSLEHVVAQDRLHREFTDQLSQGIAPVSEGTFDDVLLEDGAPVAQLTIPRIGVDETVVEGTNSSSLALGPGHRRDSSLPGQVGVSVIMGRAAAFGGPFRSLEALAPGDRFTVVTGQGEHTFVVIGVRYAGDLSPAPAKAGESRLVLETARGPWFMPTGVVRVDAQLVSDPQPRGARYTTYPTLPATHREMAGDTTRAWALVFALQLLLVTAIAAVWTYRRIGARQAWTVFVPVALLAFFVVADQAVRMLPNLM